MKIYCTGAGGFIGRALVKQGFHPLSCDVTNLTFVEKEVRTAKPDLVVHLAGKSNPDYCETHLKESVRINVNGTHNVFEACVKYRIPAVLLSSSYVWGGGWQDLFNRHSENSPMTVPVNSYGSQKSVAEFVAMTSNMEGRTSSKIIRTSHVFDRARLAFEISDLVHCKPVDAPTFLKRSFIHINHFATLLKDYCERFDSMPEVLHLAGSKTVSYFDFWLETCEQMNFSKSLIRGRRGEKNADGRAKRPHNGGLDTSLSKRLGFVQYDYMQGITEMKNES